MIKRLLFCVFFLSAKFAANAQLIEVKSFGHNQPLGIAKGLISNRLFVSFPHREPYSDALSEIIDGQRFAYPNQEWNAYNPQEPLKHFLNVQALYSDEKDILWVLDSAPRGTIKTGPGEKNAHGIFKLLKINQSTDKVEAVYTFDDLNKDESALNDVVIDNLRNLAYLSDPGLHAIVILDLITTKTRLVLQDHKSMLATPGYTLKIDSTNVLDTAGRAFVSNVNGIALTRDDNYLYYRAINQTKLYRLPVQYMADVRYRGTELANMVETVAETGVSHGMVADFKGNVYLSNSQEHSIQYVSPDKKVHTLVQDRQIIWPDSFAVAMDGYLYFTCAQINRLPKYNYGVDKTDYPYLVFKVKLPE